MLLTLLMLASTAACFTHGARGWWLLLYGSLVTPLFEELLFRGHIYDIQQQFCGYKSRVKHLLHNNGVCFPDCFSRSRYAEKLPIFDEYILFPFLNMVDFCKKDYICHNKYG